MTTANPPVEYYHLDCPCGSTVEGERQPHGQVVHCPQCGRAMQVFPASPLPFAGRVPKEEPPPVRSPAGPRRLRFWLLPGLAAAGTLALVVGLTVWLLHRPGGAPVASEQTEEQAREQFASFLAHAKRSAGEGAYHSASRELSEALRLCDLFPQLSPASVVKLRGELWQTKLLADLSGESLQEIVRHAIGLGDAEWKIIFEERYANKAVVFDVRIDPNTGGVPRIDYVLEAADTAVELDTGSLDLWQHLPLRQPTRCLFGARLADVTRDGGRWAVRFRPGSGVLFTDPDLLGGLSFAVDDELRGVLRRQSEWAADLPVGRE